MILKARFRICMKVYVWLSICDTDSEFIDAASGRIIADTAISSVDLGLCSVILVMLLICWKKDDRHKRILYSSCEYATLVRISNSFYLRYYATDLRREGPLWNDGRCLSVRLSVCPSIRLSVACLDLTRERKYLESPKLAGCDDVNSMVLEGNEGGTVHTGQNPPRGKPVNLFRDQKIKDHGYTVTKYKSIAARCCYLLCTREDIGTAMLNCHTVPRGCSFILPLIIVCG